MSVPVTPFQSEDQDKLEIDAQTKPSGSTLPKCPLCGLTFTRVQERNRHIEKYLPHSILCPFHACTWTGRRQWDFKEHWKRKKHSETSQAPEEEVEASDIYDPKDSVKSVVDGTPVDEVAWSAFIKAQEGLKILGKLDVRVNVLGRNKNLSKWIRIHHPNSTCTAFDTDL
jgi:uncharacterized C2H2 Zn-finger protein